MNAPPSPFPEAASDARTTRGTRTSAPLPVTTASPLLIACVPRPSAAVLPARSSIVPPFSASAEAPTLTPFASVSAETTV